MSQNQTNVNFNIIPLMTTNMTKLTGAERAWMLWHLHANNVTPDLVTVEIHAGDVDKPAIETLLITLVLPPNTSDSVPVSLSQISFAAGKSLYAKASVANKANVVINTEVL